MIDRDSLPKLAGDLALALREEVEPLLGHHPGRAHAGAGEGGDITFEIDERAEAFMERFLADRAPDVAFYSEDRGFVSPGPEPNWVLVVDPIDGTRPAMAGFESACVSVAAAPMSPEARLADVEVGCIVEIKSGTSFLATRGEGVEPAATLSANTALDRMFWCYGLRGRPAVPMAEVLGELIDGSSVGGSTFDLGSATYDMTRIATGQLDAYIDVGRRIVDECPETEAAFLEVGEGAVCTNFPYDVAAAALIVQEAGGLVTHADGRSLDDHPAVGSSRAHGLAVLAAAGAELHGSLLEAVDRGMHRLRDWVGRGGVDEGGR